MRGEQRSCSAGCRLGRRCTRAGPCRRRRRRPGTSVWCSPSRSICWTAGCRCTWWGTLTRSQPWVPSLSRSPCSTAIQASTSGTPSPAERRTLRCASASVPSTSAAAARVAAAAATAVAVVVVVPCAAAAAAAAAAATGSTRARTGQPTAGAATGHSSTRRTFPMLPSTRCRRLRLRLLLRASR